MRIRSKHLAKALFDLSLSSEKNLEDKFLAFVKEKNLNAQLPAVLYRVEKLIEKESEKNGIKIEFAHTVSNDTVSNIKKFLEAEKLKEYIKLNKNILAGFRASFGGVVYDASFSSKLKKLQDSIIK